MKADLNKRDDASYLQTVGRALSILEMFRQENTLSLPAIASGLGVGKTIAYRLVHTLTAEGFLIQDPLTKQYSLGEQVLLLGFCAVQKQDVKRIAHDLLWNFHERTKISTYLTIPCGNQSLCVDRVVSDSTGRLSTVFVGGVYPLFRGASNRVLLAFASPRFQSSYLHGLGLQGEERARLEEDLKRARACGYDLTRNRLTEGLFAVGFPIYNSDNQLVAGLSVGGVDDSDRPDAVDQCVQQGRQLAVEINNQMGSNYYSKLSY